MDVILRMWAQHEAQANDGIWIMAGDMNVHIGELYVSTPRRHTSGHKGERSREPDQRANVLIDALKLHNMQVMNGRVQRTRAAMHKMMTDTNKYMIDLVLMKVTEERWHIATEPIWNLEDDDGKWGSWYAKETVSDVIDL